ncbi:MAG: pyruvate synthase subunit PorB [Nanoarchaeota archaeon]|nr:pyruvate synthase subunit PorB [Nanoarchaeota archaeon]
MGIPRIELFAQGHRACTGCGSVLAMRYILKASGRNVIVCHATGCMEVVSSPYPETAWKVPWIHVAFENAAAVASGVSRALKAQGRDKEVKVMAVGGDGGTFDIGLQALSGAVERGENVCYVCYDNSAYMNTGVQRSGATEKYAATTTTPAGKKIHGKTDYKKNMPFIMAGHGNCYVATANIAYPVDLIKKVRKGLERNGPAYIQIFSTCQPGWKHANHTAIAISKLAFETNFYPLFEIEQGVLKLSMKPTQRKPVEEFFKTQGRFKHLVKEEIDEHQKHIDETMVELEKMQEHKIRINVR